MKTSELNVGDWVIQRNGWPAEVLEKSTEQDDLCILCMVHGWFTEGGSIYCHDIVAKIVPLTQETSGQPEILMREGDMANERWVVDAYIAHTAEQKALKKRTGNWY